MTVQHTPLAPEDTAGRAALRADLLDRARALGELAEKHAKEADEQRRIPDVVIDALKESQLSRVIRHHRWGGLETDPMTFLDVGRELASYNASIAWIYSVLGYHEWYMAFTSEELQREVWGEDQSVLIPDAVVPNGKAERVQDGYVLDGQWRFTSGIEWAGWVAVGAIAPAPDGDTPEHLLLFLPKSDVTVHDDWHTLGLRGTASRAITIEKKFVPEHRAYTFTRIAASNRGPAVHDGPLWRVPLMTIQGLCIMTPSIGISQRMVREFQDWTLKRLRPYDAGAEQRESPMAQITLAEATTQWEANWALAQKYAQEGWDHALVNEDYAITDEHRARLFTWRGYIGRQGINLSDDLFNNAGATALSESHPMQRIFRDIHSAGAHIGVDYGDSLVSRGRVLMGFQGHPFH